VTLDGHRRAYAEQIASTASLTTPGLKDAFAAVPREVFLPPGPWLVVGEGQQPRQTPDADPRHVYENVSVADLYELTGVQSAHTDQKWGWVDLRGSNVERTRQGGYVIALPEPVPLG